MIPSARLASSMTAGFMLVGLAAHATAQTQITEDFAYTDQAELESRYRITERGDELALNAEDETLEVRRADGDKRGGSVLMVDTTHPISWESDQSVTFGFTMRQDPFNFAFSKLFLQSTEDPSVSIGLRLKHTSNDRNDARVMAFQGPNTPGGRTLVREGFGERSTQGRWRVTLASKGYGTLVYEPLDFAKGAGKGGFKKMFSVPEDLREKLRGGARLGFYQEGGVSTAVYDDLSIEVRQTLAEGAGMAEALEIPGDFPKGPSGLPTITRAGYTGFSPAASGGRVSADYLIEKIIEPMAEHGFNAIDIKMWPGFDPENPLHMRRLREVCRAVNERDMHLFFYTMVSTAGRDPEADADLPMFVGFDGRAFPKRFSIIHLPIWKRTFHSAFALASLSEELGIDAVKFDIERFHQLYSIHDPISYDDASWTRFADDHNAVSADVPVERRWAVLGEHGLRERYEQWWAEQQRRVVRAIEQEMHRRAPGLPLGMMPGNFAAPAKKGKMLHHYFGQQLGTAEAPAVMDRWAYGVKYDAESEQQKIRALHELNPHNKVINWLSPRHNYPQDLLYHGYHLAMAADGYSVWNMRMITPRGVPKHPVAPGKSHEDYYAAFETLNAQIAADVAAGITEPQSLPLKPHRRTEVAHARKADDSDEQQTGRSYHAAKGFEIPALTPAGSGEGEPRQFVLRTNSRFYLHAERGREVTIELDPLSNSNSDVVWAVTGPDQSVVAEGSTAGESAEPRRITFEAPQTGVYAFTANSGSSPSPWYGVTVHADHMALDLPAAYLFRAAQPTLYLTRSALRGPASLTFRIGRGQIALVRLDDGPRREFMQNQPLTLELPEGQRVFALELKKPAGVKRYGLYTQDIFITVDGAVAPYASDGAERRLVPASMK